LSVTYPKGFRAIGVAAGLKASGNLDVALIANAGPSFTGAAVFTTNQIKAAPVIWTQQVAKAGVIKAVLMNSGGANACTGPQGFQDTHASVELAAKLLNIGAAEVAVCSTGLIGVPLDMPKLALGIEAAAAQLPVTDPNQGGESAARAIMTTDKVPKTATYELDGTRFGGMAKGAGMLAPSLATMLACITTDAQVTPELAHQLLVELSRDTFERIDVDGCTSTNDTVLLLASGASAAKPTPLETLREGIYQVARSLAEQIVADAEGATKFVRIKVSHAANTEIARTVARAIGRDSLVKCALNGSDPNWGRILAAVGAAGVPINASNISVSLNGQQVAKASAFIAGAPVPDLSGCDIEIVVDLGDSNAASFELLTTDLSAEYVYENSAYST
jgi:glutamate N-acetyltransferase/amino-acid N-acetyltransferase